MLNLKLYFAKITSILFLFLFLVSGCQSTEMHGQFVSDGTVEQINIKKPKKEELINMIGTPTYVPDYSADTWYYIKRSLVRRAFLNPKVSEQRIVKIIFDANKKVSQAELLKNTQSKAIVVNRDCTKTHGAEQNYIKKFVNDIGRFNQLTNSNIRSKIKK